MAHWTDDLYDLCEVITDEISKANKKLEQGGGELSAGDIEYIDKLTHALKSIKTTLAMEDYSEENYTYTGGSYGGGSYARGGGNSSRDGGSYARGRGSNAKRDSMGRYSRNGYSGGGDVEEIADTIRESMQEMSPELRREAQKFLKKLEQDM